MENLHIGTSYNGNDESPLDGLNDPTSDEKDGIPFEKPKLQFEMDIAQKPQSPPMSWAWGGLPQKTDSAFQANQEKLRKRQSTPIMSARSLSPEIRPISVKEKVDTYLSNLPSIAESRRIAIEQELTDENLELMLMVNEEDPLISCSLCGPLPELQKANAEVNTINAGNSSSI
jgi:hypothetical protein